MEKKIGVFGMGSAGLIGKVIAAHVDHGRTTLIEAVEDINCMKQEREAHEMMLMMDKPILDKPFVITAAPRYEDFMPFRKSKKKRISKPPTKFTQQPSLNAPCPCNSGKKYKRCCLINQF